jgi:hypothetical protein
MKLIFALLMLVAGQSSAGLEDVVVADYKDWTRAIAFFVDAPTSVQKEMSAAVVHARESHKQICTSQKEPHWLCSTSQFRLVRGITGTGDKSKSGFVCRDESWISHQRYYPERMLIDDDCVKINWNQEEKKHEVLWPEA